MLSKIFIKKKINNFSIFFCFLKNTMFVRRNFVWIKQILPSTSFFTGAVKSENNFVLKFFSQISFFWELFWLLTTFNYTSDVGFFAELELIGLGFRLRKITSVIYRFFWGHANYVYLFVPNGVFVEYSMDERFLFFFGAQASLVNGLSSYLMLLKKISSYRITGFLKPGKIIRLNSGKQR